VMTSNREIGPSEGVVIVVIIGLRLCLISYAECPVEKGGSSSSMSWSARADATNDIASPCRAPPAKMGSQLFALSRVRSAGLGWPAAGLMDSKLS